MTHHRWLVSLLSLGLLGAVVHLALEHGEILLNMRRQVLALTVAAAMLTLLGNGLVLKWITHAFEQPLSVAEAMTLTALGALTNAAGGIPVGTALTLAILVQRHRFELTQIIFGKIVATILSVCTLAALCLLIGQPAEPAALPWLLGTIATGGLVALKVVGRLQLARLKPVVPALSGRLLLSGIGLSVVSACGMLLSYVIVVGAYIPELSLQEAVTLAGCSLIAGQSLFAGSLAGLQEVIVGLGAMSLSLKFATGLELGLFVRLASLIAAALALPLAWLVQRRAMLRRARPIP